LGPHPSHDPDPGFQIGTVLADLDPWFEIFADPDPDSGLISIKKIIGFHVKKYNKNFGSGSKCTPRSGSRDLKQCRSGSRDLKQCRSGSKDSQNADPMLIRIRNPAVPTLRSLDFIDESQRRKIL